jgi:hypothetical protein
MQLTCVDELLAVSLAFLLPELFSDPFPFLGSLLGLEVPQRVFAFGQFVVLDGREFEPIEMDNVQWRASLQCGLD